MHGVTTIYNACCGVVKHLRLGGPPIDEQRCPVLLAGGLQNTMRQLSIKDAVQAGLRIDQHRPDRGVRHRLALFLIKCLVYHNAGTCTACTAHRRPAVLASCMPWKLQDSAVLQC